MLTKLTTSIFAKTQPEREVHEDEDEHEHEHEVPCYPSCPERDTVLDAALCARKRRFRNVSRSQGRRVMRAHPHNRP